MYIMFKWFKKNKKDIEKQPKCIHDFENLGKFYQIFNSPYMNGEDTVYIKIRYICSKCGEVYDEILTERDYNIMSFDDLDEKADFLKEIKSRKDIIADYEMNEETLEYKRNLIKGEYYNGN